ncbi:hypothetical protein RB201_14930 [Streptomyces sp. S1A(2023)]
MRLRRANWSTSRKSASSPPGPDSTAPWREPPESASVTAAEVARDLVDGGPDGRARRRKQCAQLGGVDGALAAVAAGGEDAAGAQQGAEQAGDLVEGLAGHLAEEVGEGTEQGADDEPE